MPVGWYLTGFDDGQRATVEELGDVDGAGALVEDKAEGHGADRPCGGRVSRRLRNYEFNPVWAFLPDQAWLR